MIKHFEPDRLKKRIILMVVLLIIPAVILEIWSVNRLATLGSEISSIEKSKAALTLENQVLENEIAQKSALNNVDDKSKQMGFQKVKTVTYFEQNLALNR